MGSLGSSGVVGFTRVRFSSRWVHLRAPCVSLGSFGGHWFHSRAVGVDRFVRGHWVRSRVPWV